MKRSKGLILAIQESGRSTQNSHLHITFFVSSSSSSSLLFLFPLPPPLHPYIRPHSLLKLSLYLWQCWIIGDQNIEKPILIDWYLVLTRLGVYDTVLGTVHSLTVLSSDPEAILEPLGESATDVTGPICPVRAPPTTWPITVSHILTEAS